MCETEWRWLNSETTYRRFCECELSVRSKPGGKIFEWMVGKNPDRTTLVMRYGTSWSMIAGKIAAETAAVKLQNSR
jgi:hypothetical protein